MGYTTEFEGELKFTPELTTGQLKHLSDMLGEDVREHPEWHEGFPAAKDLYYIQFELTKDFDGIKWDGSEKFYGAESCVNLLTYQMRKIVPEFRFTGTLKAQGEEFRDLWMLAISESGRAYKQEIKIEGDIIECPDCGHEFQLATKS